MKTLSRYFAAILTCILFAPGANSQEAEFDGNEFVKSLNEQLEEKGITVIGDAAAFESDGVTGDGLDEIVREVPVMKEWPEYGIVAKARDGTIVDVFGAGVPYTVDADQIKIPGYQAPQGVELQTVGSWEYLAASDDLYAKFESASVPSKSIQKAVDKITAATDYVASTLCPKKSRPTKIVLNLSAGFELVFNAQTGSQVEWDLEVVCTR